MTGKLTSESMEKRIRDYFDACNSGDPGAIASHFVSDGVHYFPPGMYLGPFRGADVIGARWHAAVQNLGSIWTVDQVVTDPETARAVIEWTHFKTFEGTVLRGDEWYIFDADSGLIREIRAYYASPQDKSLETLQLEGYDYAGLGYPVVPPFSRRGPTATE